MRREPHVRIREGEGVQFPLATRLVMGFQYRQEAERFLEDLRERMRRFSLELHPEKTRLIEFGRFAAEQRKARGQGKPETFSFLGFTHICGKTKAGRFLLTRHTMAKRLRAKLQEITTELKRRRHQNPLEQGAWLTGVVRGYFQYHAIPTNICAIGAFRTQVARAWLQALRRRSQHDRTTWEQMRPRVATWLPRARILHPWPEVRFDARTQGKSRMR